MRIEPTLFVSRCSPSDTVSVVIPCLNEEAFIGECINSVLANDYPRELIEIFIVDGMSTDSTRDIVRGYEANHDFVHLLDNPKKTTPAALNEGIRRATGDIVIRLDAHTVYNQNYILKCVETLNACDAANVGGVIKTLPGRDTLLAKAIASSISHPFGVGPSYFRVSTGGIRYVDTVPFGCFRRELFSQVGLFDEELPPPMSLWIPYRFRADSQRGNEDYEFNKRLRDAGFKIVLNAEIVSSYYAQGTMLEFVRHNFDNGRLVTAPLGINKMAVSVRHLAPLLAIMALAIAAVLAAIDARFGWLLASGAAAYAVATLAVSAKIAADERDLAQLFLMPLTFGILHASYGAGSLWGLAEATMTRLRAAFGRGDASN